MQAIGEKKYYMKYLSVRSHAKNSAAGKDVDAVSSKMHFEMWKERQHCRLERFDNSQYSGI